MMTMSEALASDDLPPDNASRIAIYDVLPDSVSKGVEPDVVSINELFAVVIPRLRVLVPRELHISTERGYVHEKIDACVESGLLERVGPAQEMVQLTGRPPQIRYPDGTVRDYHRGLEPARERLDAVNSKLRDAHFDVRGHVPTLAEATDSPEFQALVASIREHGFLKQYKVAAYSDGTVVDGRARVAAAGEAGEAVEYLTQRTRPEQAAARRRDTPLHRVLLALDANSGRLSDDDRQRVRDVVSDVAGRPWDEIAADLALTREWRRAVPAVYYPRFEVRLMSYRPDGEPKIQVTPDEKVMLRSLLESAGLTNWKIKDLKDYVAIEEARTQRSMGRKAGFAPIEDLISGIEAMQHDRRARKLKLDPEWDDIRAWLITNFSPPAASDGRAQ
jgi:hypothetical protein